MRANTWVAIAGVTVSLALGKFVMTGKHPRSEDTAIEDKRDSKQARSMQQGASTTPGPTAKEIKAADEARARLAGAEVWQCAMTACLCSKPCTAWDGCTAPVAMFDRLWQPQVCHALLYMPWLRPARKRAVMLCS